MLTAHLRNDFETVEKNEEVRKVLGWMRGETRRRPIITDGGRPYGIPNRSAFMDSRIIDRAAVAKYTQPVPVPREDADVAEALAAMSEAFVPYVPVRDGRDRVAGYVDALDLLRNEDGPDAGAVAMPVARLAPTDTLGKAIHDFRGQHTDHLPVLDAGRLVGVLPRQALIGVETNRTVPKGSGDLASDTDHMLRDTVADLMQQGAITVAPAMPFARLVARLGETGYAFVGDEARIMGVVTPEIAVRAVRPMRTAPTGRHGGPGVPA